jgi:hypothetical protein
MWKGARRKRPYVQSLVFGDFTLGRKYFTASRFQRPRRLRHRSVAARLLVFRVWIPLGVWMSVSCECCVLSGRGICFRSITGMEKSPTECSVSEYNLETSTKTGLRPTRAFETRRNFTARRKLWSKIRKRIWSSVLDSSTSLFLFDFFLCRSKFKQKLITEIHDKWVFVTTAWRVLRLRMEKRPPIWRVAANTLNKQSRTADKGCLPAWGLSEMLPTPYHKIVSSCETVKE